jgi:hypothetical protein
VAKISILVSSSKQGNHLVSDFSELFESPNSEVTEKQTAVFSLAQAESSLATQTLDD